VLRLEDICLKLGSFELRNVSLEIKDGEYLVLLGPTGTGKTVLLETIAGLHRPGRGKIFLKGQDFTMMRPETRHLGVVYQDYALFPHLNIYRNIAFGLRLRGESKASIKIEVDRIAGFLDIRHLLRRRITNLSGGERQRVALARALVMKPHVLLLDEPLSALDRSTRDRLQRELKRIHREIGVTIFHITHDLSEAFFLGDRLAVMKDGEIQQEGLPDEVLGRPVNRFVAGLLGIENFIPATVREHGKIEIDGLGLINSDIPVSASGGESQIDLTVPGWAVEIFPEKGRDAYLWQGKMHIRNVNHTDGHSEIELAHESGVSLRTTISRREATGLPNSLADGSEVMTGLLREGVHWVSRDDKV